MLTEFEIEIPVEVDEETYAWLLKYSVISPGMKQVDGRAVPGAGTHHSNPSEHKARAGEDQGHARARVSGEAGPKQDQADQQRDGQDHRGGGHRAPARAGLQGRRGCAAVVRGYTGGNNYAVDVFADHQAIELKGGSLANSKGAQQWRVKYGQETEVHVETGRTKTKREYRDALVTEVPEGQREGAASGWRRTAVRRSRPSPTPPSSTRTRGTSMSTASRATTCGSAG